ncbi:hypothetical protein AHAS_Ahas13G0524900 [Arachis hypogaea]
MLRYLIWFPEYSVLADEQIQLIISFFQPRSAYISCFFYCLIDVIHVEICSSFEIKFCWVGFSSNVDLNRVSCGYDDLMSSCSLFLQIIIRSSWKLCAFRFLFRCG